MSLTELFFGIVLSSLLAFGALSSLHAATEIQHRLEIHEKSLRELNKLEQIFQTELQKAQSLYAFVGYRIQQNGMLTRTDGRVLSQKGYRPHPDSDALTFAQPLFGVVFRKKTTDEYCLETFVSSAEKPQLTWFTPFLALGSGGVHQVSVRFVRSKRSGVSCSAKNLYHAIIREENDAVFVSAEGSPILLIPLEDVFTLYLDENGLVRRQSHVTGSSQALGGPFTTLRMHLESDGILLVVDVETESRESSGRIERSLLFPIRGVVLSPLDVSS